MMASILFVDLKYDFSAPLADSYSQVVESGSVAPLLLRRKELRRCFCLLALVRLSDFDARLGDDAMSLGVGLEADFAELLLRFEDLQMVMQAG